MPPAEHDLACIIHCHSTHSDGTGTVAEIAAAAARAGVGAVLLTDHDTLAAQREGEERWHGSVLVCVGEEVSPKKGGHFLAFGIRKEIDRKLGPEGIVEATVEAGGFGIAAHPFSSGNERYRERFGDGTPFRALDAPGLTGIELWSWVTDTAEQVGGLQDALRFVVRPGHHVDHPPARNMAGWDRLLAERPPIVAVGGVDAHQFGRRIGNSVPLRLMSYERSFRHLRTHVLLDGAPSGRVAEDRDAIYAALRGGRCYLAVDSVAPAAGFSFWADGPEPVRMGELGSASDDLVLRARLPRPATLRLLRDGEQIAHLQSAGLAHRAPGPGVYRLEARLPRHGADRTWIVSNPIYLR